MSAFGRQRKYCFCERYLRLKYKICYSLLYYSMRLIDIIHFSFQDKNIIAFAHALAELCNTKL